ncbi:class I SAM-dependent methyltransferase [Tepidamorphus sp. 3E244]|uniref:class I SAM-dependent methyltransferase n=1 Tax=Tepidamorphus sp. 3E244 TaxID=3385498 RepID=UPI0038FCF9DF
MTASNGMTGDTTPLEAILKQEIAERGPIPVSRFMARALGDPVHGYYTTANPFGTEGDFTTAPEISQLFGEILGAWLVQMATAIGASAPGERIAMVELGPGRGTLMADIVRVAQLRPEIDARLDVHLVEMSPRLREIQAKTIAASRPDRPAPTFHDTIDTVPALPLVLVANEFFDALPIEQVVMGEDGWNRRMVALEDGALVFANGEKVAITADIPGAEPGVILETCPAAHAITTKIATRMTKHPGAGVIIDYGYERMAVGDTLQALRHHAPCGVLEHVGQADITAHVCFANLGHAAMSVGAQAFGPMTQTQFLGELGIAQRAEAIIRRNPQKRGEVETALARLTSPDAMGSLFKVMALISPGPDAPPPFV